MTILEKMLENCKKAGYCDGNNSARYCISELCRSDIERDGICHCHCYTKANIAAE